MGNSKWVELSNKLSKQFSEKFDAIRADKNAAVSVSFILDGEPVATICAGTIDCEENSVPVTEKTLFNIGSISKVYCALAVTKLTELGLADMDTPVYEYLPEFRMRDERYKKITLRMCIDHTSGLPGTLMNRAFGSRWIGEGFSETAYKYFAESILKADPGSHSVYCNDGFILAELVIEKCADMSYTDFLTKYILVPAGAVSACTGANVPAEAERAHEKGKPVETLSLVASGGVISNLADCAAVGNLFIDSKGVLSQAGIDAVASEQGKSFLKDEVASSFGYGWDSVNFTHPQYEFGANTLMKSGGTLQFGSYLLVSREHKLSAAISGTMSNGIEPLSVLCDMCAELLEAAGIHVTKEAAAPETAPVALPEGFEEKYRGIYHNFMGTYAIDFADGNLVIKSYVSGAMYDMIPAAVYDGTQFNFGPMSFSFQDHGSNHYLMQSSLIGNTAFAQTVADVPEPSEEWVNRIGKKYIVCDSSPYDVGIGGMYCGLKLDRLADSNLILFCTKAPFLPFGTLPVGIKDGAAYMPLDAPGGAGSRDQFAPVVLEKDGTEYIYERGYTYVSVDSLPELEAGTVQAGGETVIYHIPEGKTFQISSADEVRCILLSEELDITYDGLIQDGMPAAASGFIMLLCEAEAVVKAEAANE